MRVIVSGSRRYTRKAFRPLLLADLDHIGAPAGKGLTIVQGGQVGADLLARAIAEEWGANSWTFPAEWRYYEGLGHRNDAGKLRNAEMLNTMPPDFVLAYPLPGSVGTWHMVNLAHKRGFCVIVNSGGTRGKPV
jgi:hypothetical protein